MEDSKKILKTLIVGIIVYSLVILLIGLAFLENKFSFTLGIIAGGAVACGLALNLYNSLDYCLGMEPESAEKLMRKKAVIRYLVMVASMGSAFYFSRYISPLGMIVGLMGLKISAYLQPFIHR